MRRPTRAGKPPRKRADAKASAASDELAPVFDAVAAYFGLLAEPTRLAILHTICNDEQSVSAIVEATGATQTNVSRHLGAAARGRRGGRRRDGSTVLLPRRRSGLRRDLPHACACASPARIDAQSPLAGDLLDYARARR